ncbi:unnamed protein product [Prorocentrum cordatum]|uniref:Uncharacterized protein n=1 Tax=Prorocentrum cordatum TaxID=2364126 RepID=A0ABN9UJV3_9DINO|nr:unnamed protein product [Polarella glacialis]
MNYLGIACHPHAVGRRRRRRRSRGREEGVRQGDEDRAKGRHGGPQAAGGSCTEATRTRTPRQASSLSTTISDLVLARGRRAGRQPQHAGALRHRDLQQHGVGQVLLDQGVPPGVEVPDGSAGRGGHESQVHDPVAELHLRRKPPVGEASVQQCGGG